MLVTINRELDELHVQLTEKGYEHLQRYYSVHRRRFSFGRGGQLDVDNHKLLDSQGRETGYWKFTFDLLFAIFGGEQLSEMLVGTTISCGHPLMPPE